ncbi:MAG: STAS domain-containing protein [Chitinivibrionales bacterium]
MVMSMAESTTYDVCNISGEMTINSLVKASQEFTRHLSENDTKDLVLDLSDVPYMDSAGIRLLVNLKKRLSSNNRSLYLLSPSQDVARVITETNIHTMVPVLKSIEHLDNKAIVKSYALFEDVSYTDEHGFKRLECRCPVCNAHQVVAYWLNPNDFSWKWDQPYFPTCLSVSDQKRVDLFALSPIICTECWFTSIRPEEFILCKDGKPIADSILSREAINALMKLNKKRREIMSIGRVIGDNFFLYPRDTIASQRAYLLAEQCARAHGGHQHCNRSFTIGYLNYCGLKYAAEHEQKALLENCRTWITSALSQHLAVSDRLTGLFMMVVVYLRLGRKKQAREFLHKLDTLAQSSAQYECPKIKECPAFWTGQAHYLWEQNELNAAVGA